MDREEYTGDVRKTGKSGGKILPTIKVEGMSSRRKVLLMPEMHSS